MKSHLPIAMATEKSKINFRKIDETPHLVSSYRLRYQVYCKERGFLVSSYYPCGEEMDAYDKHSLHFGALTEEGDMVGTVRLVQSSSLGFPLQNFCRPCEGHIECVPARQVAEISRLAFPRAARRRFTISSELKGFEPLRDYAPTAEQEYQMVMGLYRVMYQESKRAGITHWVAAMEKSLLRLLRQYNFHFRPIGPETDYYGPVTPVMASIAEIEESIFSQTPKIFWALTEGLEPQYRPHWARVA